jgi:hypothetical protein
VLRLVDEEDNLVATVTVEEILRFGTAFRGGQRLAPTPFSLSFEVRTQILPRNCSPPPSRPKRSDERETDRTSAEARTQLVNVQGPNCPTLGAAYLLALSSISDPIPPVYESIYLAGVM